MIKRGEFYGENAFEIAQSAVQRVPFVFNSPHSGRNYPKSLRNASRLSDHALRQSEDVMVDELFLPVVGSVPRCFRQNFRAHGLM